MHLPVPRRLRSLRARMGNMRSSAANTVSSSRSRVETPSRAGAGACTHARPCAGARGQKQLQRTGTRLLRLVVRLKTRLHLRFHARHVDLGLGLDLRLRQTARLLLRLNLSLCGLDRALAGRK